MQCAVPIQRERSIVHISMFFTIGPIFNALYNKTTAVTLTVHVRRGLTTSNINNLNNTHTHTHTHTHSSIIWLQKRREEVMERLRGSSQRKEEQHEMQIGRLKQDRVRVPRGENVSGA